MNLLKLVTATIPFVFTASVQSTELHYFVIAKQAKPFQIEENGENHRGIVTDILKEVFKNHSEYRIVYHTYPFNRMISTLESGNTQNWITYGSPGWGGVQAANLSKTPIYNVRHYLLSSKKEPFNFKTIDDLKGKSVALLYGFDYPDLVPYIKSNLFNELRVKDYAAAFRIIQKRAGESAFVEMGLRINYHLNKEGKKPSNFKMQPLSSVIPDYSIYLALSPQIDSKLQQLIDKRLEEMAKKGELEAISMRYQ